MDVVSVTSPVGFWRRFCSSKWPEPAVAILAARHTQEVGGAVKLGILTWRVHRLTLFRSKPLAASRWIAVLVTSVLASREGERGCRLIQPRPLDLCSAVRGHWRKVAGQGGSRGGRVRAKLSCSNIDTLQCIQQKRFVVFLNPYHLLFMKHKNIKFKHCTGCY